MYKIYIYLLISELLFDKECILGKCFWIAVAVSEYNAEHTDLKVRGDQTHWIVSTKDDFNDYGCQWMAWADSKETVSAASCLIYSFAITSSLIFSSLSNMIESLSGQISLLLVVRSLLCLVVPWSRPILDYSQRNIARCQWPVAL